MIRKMALALACVAALAACDKMADKKVAAAAPAAPPAMPHFVPMYQTRADAPAGDRLAAGRDGAALFSNRCGSCHLALGMGTNLLTKQRLAMGEPPENGLLANRKDLTSDYVKAVVRQGKMAMPRLTHVDVTDAELEAIAKYLGKAD